nr:nuclear transport factor 2 family protein [uncultured Steroidobacter sp.]
MKYLFAGAAGLLLAAGVGLAGGAQDLSANKALVEQFFRAVGSRDKQTVIRIVREDYIQHMPNIPSGRAAILN